MAVKKKVTRKPAAAKEAARKTPTPAPAAVAPVKRGKGGLIAALLVLVIVGLGAEVFYLMQQKKARVIELVHSGPIVDKTIPDTVSLKGDAEGNFYRLNGREADWKFHKYNQSLTLVAEYTPKSKDGIIFRGTDIAFDKDGNPWVSQRDGKLRGFDKNMKLVRTVVTGATDVMGLDFDDQNRAHLTCQGDNKVEVYTLEGRKVEEYGTPDSPSGVLSRPDHIVIRSNGEIVLMERLTDSLRLKVLGKDHKVLRSIIILPKQVTGQPNTAMGVDDKGRAYLNDNNNSVVVFDMNKPKYLGASRSTQDNQFILSPGYVGANKYNGDIYVDFIPGVMKCRYPAATK